MMHKNLTIVIPARRTEYELDAMILSVQKRLAFLELPVCRESMEEATRLSEVKETTAKFKALLMEREALRGFDSLYD
jgi:hypothetical protein